jgi:hypothetical protein
MNDGDAATESAKRLVCATEQSTSAGSQSVHNKIAIVRIQQKNKPNVIMIGVQGAESLNEILVFGRPISEKHNICWNFY